MEEIDAKELLETICDAKQYLKTLEIQQKQLKNAEKQIVTSAQIAENEINTTFNNLLRNLTEIIDARKCELLQSARNIRDNNLVPIKKSQSLIEEKLSETKKLLEITNAHERIDQAEFMRKSSQLGSLPEVPELNQVTFITFQHNDFKAKHIIEECKQLGVITRIAPVQIANLYSKPGAILVEWEILESDEPFSDVQEYHLQKAAGNYNVDTELIFHDCYKGQETQYLIQDLTPLQDYSFRIRCKFEGCDYSPWSMVQVSKTVIQPYSWQSNDSCLLSNQNKIITSQVNCLAFSDGRQFKVGDTLDFTCIEIPSDIQLNDNFIGLADVASANFILNPGSFMLEATGKVYIDGGVKSTQFPALAAGTKVSFTCLGINDDKLRINIDVNDKRVTYDWNISYENGLYFLAKLQSAKWKILVE